MPESTNNNIPSLPEDFTVKPEVKSLFYRGSISHGMYVPNTDPDSIDDIDLMGIVIPELDHYFGVRSEWGSKGTKESWHGNVDCVFYELRKFISLLLKQNPNVLGVLWLPDRYIIQDAGNVLNVLTQYKHVFASKSAFHSFAGYANSQLKRMTRTQHNGYMGAKRKALVEKHGYDTKNAIHLIRLLRMCREYLDTGSMNVDRSGIDAGELLNIKKGSMSLEDVKSMAGDLFEDCRKAYEKSPLPEEPKYDVANFLCRDILEEHFYGIK